MALVTSVAVLGMSAADAARAKLLVSIMVDGLDVDKLEMLKECFGDGGFRRFERHGALILNADYGPGLDAAAAAATFVTGASPAVSGVGRSTRYNVDALREQSVYADADVLGNFTETGYSPAALKVSTVADELRIAFGGINAVYSVAADHTQTIALAGHAADLALWLDEKTGNWASSTYYREMPSELAARNRNEPLVARLDTMSWVPSLELGKYPLPEHLQYYPFRHVFPRSASERISMFFASPLANTEVTNVAIDLLDLANFEHSSPVVDVLNVAYNLQPYTYGKNDDTRFELIDAYVKLDRDMERLFAGIDKLVGLDSTVVVLAATPPRRQHRRDDELWRIPYGEFSTRKAVSLLNVYLMAVYGNGEYVTAWNRGQFYLNHRLLKERSLDEREVRIKAATFLAKMTGVARVHTYDEIIEGRAGENGESLRRNMLLPDLGDLFMNVAPGFELVDDFNSYVPARRVHMVERTVGTTAPVYILAPDIAKQTLAEPIDARAVAPTVCRLLRIRSPNGASLPPVSLKKK